MAKKKEKYLREKFAGLIKVTTFASAFGKRFGLAKKIISRILRSRKYYIIRSWQ